MRPSSPCTPVLWLAWGPYSVTVSESFTFHVAGGFPQTGHPEVEEWKQPASWGRGDGGSTRPLTAAMG